MSVEMSVKVPVEMSVEVPVETPVTIFIAEVTELKEPECKRFFGKSSHGLWKQARSRNPEFLQRQEEETNVLPQEAHRMAVGSNQGDLLHDEQRRRPRWDSVHQRMDEDDARRRRRDTEI